ncbi:restriction endonuclease subunit S [Vallitaleaceae bacterium 9-2]
MVALKEIFKISKGKKEEETENESRLSPRYIQIEDLRHNDNLKYCIPNKKSVYVNKHDLIIAWDGANAGTIGVGLEGVIGSTLARLELKNNKVNPYYAARFLQSKFQYLRDNCTGATIPHISKTVLENLSIPLPPLETQKKIVEVLDMAQGLIDARKEQIRLMDELIQSVFYEMFGDPVTNPKGWETGTINDLTLKTQYGTSKKAHETGGEYPMLRMNNISYTGGWDFSSLKYVDLDENELEKYLVYEGELLFNRTNSKELVGKTAVYRESKPMAYAGYLVKLITNTKGNTEYISAYLNSQHGKATLLNMAKSIVGMANINAEELKKIRINLPPIDVQNDFADIVSRIEKERKKLSESIRNYEDNYSSILQKAFVGKLF